MIFCPPILALLTLFLVISVTNNDSAKGRGEASSMVLGDTLTWALFGLCLFMAGHDIYFHLVVNSLRIFEASGVDPKTGTIPRKKKGKKKKKKKINPKAAEAAMSTVSLKKPFCFIIVSQIQF